jgi:hypothetical protein
VQKADKEALGFRMILIYGMIVLIDFNNETSKKKVSLSGFRLMKWSICLTNSGLGKLNQATLR